MPDASDLCEGNAAGRAAVIDHVPVEKIERGWRRLQQRAGKKKYLGAQLVRGLKYRLAADRGRARGIGTAAIGRRIGVPGDHAHLLDRHAEHAGRDLAHDGVHALALLGDADRADDAAARLELDGAGVLRGNRGTPHAIIAFGAWRRSLDEGRDPDAAMDALLAQSRLLG